MDNKLLGLLSLLLLAFVSFALFVFFNEPITRFTRASQQNNVPSLENSLIFAWPLTVSADGTEQSTITVFVRSNDGRAIPEETVVLNSTLGNVQEASLVTDEQGKVEFHLTSGTPGVADLTALIQDRELTRTVSVKFE